MTFIYVLRLTPEYELDENWSPETDRIINDHFDYLQKATEEGKAILVGRTDYETGHDDLFGIVVFEAEDEKAAHDFMMNDPSIVNGVMEGDLHPFSLALLRTAVE